MIGALSMDGILVVYQRETPRGAESATFAFFILRFHYHFAKSFSLPTGKSPVLGFGWITWGARAPLLRFHFAFHSHFCKNHFRPPLANSLLLVLAEQLGVRAPHLRFHFAFSLQFARSFSLPTAKSPVLCFGWITWGSGRHFCVFILCFHFHFVK